MSHFCSEMRVSLCEAGLVTLAVLLIYLQMGRELARRLQFALPITQGSSLHFLSRQTDFKRLSRFQHGLSSQQRDPEPSGQGGCACPRPGLTGSNWAQLASWAQNPTTCRGGAHMTENAGAGPPS
ncbi:unnamed protein product [Rangifer tarandus platyrhynchus]|uniref:Uncharacterized protein n=2 Tax=Rangifer tarandus platyrhynchus TaxID=3082113 RepID=A0ABN8ZJZ8_RANTA|nr:unnamed protein product [Rangifer tarandus platyrhynchus]